MRLIDADCRNCGKPYKARMARYERLGYGFCCRSCGAQYNSRHNHPMKGKHHTEEARRKMALAKLGRSMPEETRKKVSEGLRGPKSYRWKGGKTRHGGGYVTICASDHGKRQELEHRRVMELIIGRPLLPTEIVHHIDGDKTNNAPENLLLLSGQSEHMRLHGRCWDARGRLLPKQPVQDNLNWPERIQDFPESR